jgi:hypothetical protein
VREPRRGRKGKRGGPADGVTVRFPCVLRGFFWSLQLEHDVVAVVDAFDADGGVLWVVEVGDVVVFESEFDGDPDGWLYCSSSCLRGVYYCLLGVIDAAWSFVRGGCRERDLGCDGQIGLAGPASRVVVASRVRSSRCSPHSRRQHGR